MGGQVQQDAVAGIGRTHGAHAETVARLLAMSAEAQTVLRIVLADILEYLASFGSREAIQHGKEIARRWGTS